MSYLNELRDKRGVAVTAARAIIDKCEAEGRAMTTEEDQSWSAHMSESDALKDQVDKAERQQSVDREVAGHVAKAADSAAPDSRSEAEDAAGLEVRAIRKFIGSGVHSMTPEESRALKFDSNEAGGFLSAPQQFVAQLIKAVDDDVFIRQRANVIQLAGAHSIGAPSLDADPEDGTWTSEVGSVDEDTQMDFGNRELEPNQLTKLVKVSMKLLLQSAMPVDSLVAQRLAYKFAITQEKAFMTGSGASQPMGVFTANSNGISTGRDVSTGNSTSAIGADGLINAKFSCKGQYHRTGEWIFHRDAVKAISKLKDGEGQYLWQPGLQASSPDMLLGRPVLMSENAPNTFTTGLYVGIFGDFSHYWIADSLQFELQRLNELYAANSQVGFIGRMWTDGMPVLEEAFARVTLA